MDATEPTVKNVDRSPWGLWAVLAVAGAVALVYLVFFRGLGAPNGTASEFVGKKMPFLQLEPLTGEAQPVSTVDLVGRVTVVNLWGTWCAPCRREFPDIVALAKRFSAETDFRLYAVSCGDEGDDSDLASLRVETEGFLRAHNTTLSTYADRNGETRRAMLYGLDMQAGLAYPTTLVIDRQGIIRGCWVGIATAQEMETLVESLLARSTAAQPSGDVQR